MTESCSITRVKVAHNAVIASRSIRFPALDCAPWLRCVVTERASALPLGGDMSFATGAADRDGVAANRRRALARINRSPIQAVMCGLVHGTTVRRVSGTDRGRGVLSPLDTIKATDGMITDEPGLTLMMCFADCVPLIVVDMQRRAIGLAHAGWRGTLAGMAATLVMAMRGAYGSDPASLIAAIGPSIGPESYTVGDEVIAPFTRVFPEDDIFVSDERGTRLNLWEANAKQFVRAGLAPDAVSCAGICTFKNGARLFSHRYARAYDEPEGRFAVLLSMEG